MGFCWSTRFSGHSNRNVGFKVKISASSCLPKFLYLKVQPKISSAKNISALELKHYMIWFVLCFPTRNGRFQTLFRESVKFSNFEKLFWSGGFAEIFSHLYITCAVESTKLFSKSDERKVPYQFLSSPVGFEFLMIVWV